MKKLIAMGIITLAITFTPTVSGATVIEKAQTVNHVLYGKAIAVNATIKKLNKTVGKTWYVFSGATPKGWDCSGLTMWFYQQLDIQLEHRASKQQSAGVETKTPKAGDLVVFKYKESKSAYHP